MGSDALFSVVLAPAQQSKFRNFVREHFPEASIRPEPSVWDGIATGTFIVSGLTARQNAALKLDWR
jgi:hypothetical protein